MDIKSKIKQKRKTNIILYGTKQGIGRKKIKDLFCRFMVIYWCLYRHLCDLRRDVIDTSGIYDYPFNWVFRLIQNFCICPVENKYHTVKPNIVIFVSFCCIMASKQVDLCVDNCIAVSLCYWQIPEVLREHHWWIMLGWPILLLWKYQ